jgi:hypothetical protein
VNDEIVDATLVDLNRHVRGIIDRAIILHFDPPNEEVHRKVREWLDNPEVYAFIGEVMALAPSLSIRHYFKGVAAPTGRSRQLADQLAPVVCELNAAPWEARSASHHSMWKQSPNSDCKPLQRVRAGFKRWTATVTGSSPWPSSSAHPNSFVGSTPTGTAGSVAKKPNTARDRT